MNTKNLMKKTEGITLVALVITIIVLLILAGVTLSIVVNGQIVDKSQNAVAKYQDSSKNEDEQIGYLDAVFGNFLANITATSTSGGGSTNPPAVTTQWTIETDSGTTGLSVGDLIKPTISSVASEKFYVIGKDDTAGTVTLLAEKNVKTNDATEANNIQSGSANTLAFRADSSASNANVYAASDIKGYVDAYAGKLVTAGLTLEDVETAEGGSAVTGTKGRLMWGTSSSGEVKTLIDGGLTNILYGPEGAKLNYWLGSPCAGDTERRLACVWR